MGFQPPKPVRNFCVECVGHTLYAFGTRGLWVLPNGYPPPKHTPSTSCSATQNLKPNIIPSYNKMETLALVYRNIKIMCMYSTFNCELVLKILKYIQTLSM